MSAYSTFRDELKTAILAAWSDINGSVSYFSDFQGASQNILNLPKPCAVVLCGRLEDDNNWGLASSRQARVPLSIYYLSGKAATVDFQQFINDKMETLQTALLGGSYTTFRVMVDRGLIDTTSANPANQFLLEQQQQTRAGLLEYTDIAVAMV